MLKPIIPDFFLRITINSFNSGMILLILFVGIPIDKSNATPRDSIKAWIDQAITEDDGKTDILGVDTLLMKRVINESKAIGDPELETLGNMYMGIHYNIKEIPINALGYLQEAHRISIENKVSKPQDQILMCTGLSHFLLGQHEKAQEYYEKALAMNEEDSYSTFKMNILNNMANNLGSMGRIEEALEKYKIVYETSQQLIESNPDYGHFMSIANNNMGYIYLQMRQPKKALRHLNESHDYVMKIGEPRDVAPSYGNLAYCYYLMGDFGQAYDFYFKSLDISESNNLPYVTYVTYKDLSETYEADGQTGPAIEYLNKYYQLKDSLHGARMQEKLFQANNQHQIRLNELEIDKLEQQNRIQKQTLFITIGGLIMLLVLGLLIFRNMYLANQHRKEIATQELEKTKQRDELQKLKLEKLNQELSHKQQDISRMAIDISRKQEFYQELLGQIEQLKLHIKPEASKDWRSLEQTIKDKLQTTEEQSLFNENIEQINQSFYENLRSRFPKLSKSDLDLCGFIKIGLSNKEIANLRAVSPEAVRVGKFRLKKKLELDSNQDVERYLQGL